MPASVHSIPLEWQHSEQMRFSKSFEKNMCPHARELSLSKEVRVLGVAFTLVYS